MNTAFVEELIITTLLRKGEGEPRSPIRIITQIWRKNGELIAEVDPWEPLRNGEVKIHFDIVKGYAADGKDKELKEHIRLLGELLGF